MNLTLLIIVPLISALLVLAARKSKQVRILALAGALAQFILSLGLLFAYYSEREKGNDSAFLFEYNFSWFSPLRINFHLGADGISVAMIVLTAFVVLAGILVSWTQELLTKEFFFLLLFLSVGAYGYFLSLDIFLLFFFLEIAVLPKFLLIGIWGTGKKEYSAMKLALMLMAGSALVFVGLAGLYFKSSASGAPNFDLSTIASSPMEPGFQKIFFPFAFLGFGIFGALFPFHTWVPDGHSSAPTAASMFLAGISMKLGGYGCLRVATYLMPDAAHFYSPWIIGLSTIAIIYGAFATMMQKDLKYLNAYSSVSHCGFVLLGIGMLTHTSINGAVLQMVSHGLMTALFFAAIGMIYNRTHTRMIDQLGGLLKVMPFISSIFVIAGLCSLGLPGLSGFVAEITVFMGSWQNPDGYYRLATILACCSIVVTAVYILRAAGKTVMGPIRNTDYTLLKDATWNERLAAGILIIGIVSIGVAPFWISQLLDGATGNIMRQLARGVIIK